MSIQVIGVGLDGVQGLSSLISEQVKTADFLIGSDRHLSYFPENQGQRLVLEDLSRGIKEIQNYLMENPHHSIVILVSGDPLFFGLGRLLLSEFPPETLTFHPHISSVQLAFSRVKIPWQDVRFISSHGRSFEELIVAVKQGFPKIAILTDHVYNPNAIANLLLALDLPTLYQCWVCENLGATNERVNQYSLKEVLSGSFAALNVVILIKETVLENDFDLQNLPLLGIPDQYFLSYPDRPGLITKREIRQLILGELGLQSNQVIWDIGAGTGSVSIEMARLFPTSQVYAIEKSAIGTNLIEKNTQRFRLNNVISIHGKAPEILQNLRPPHRIFIGGNGGELTKILGICSWRLLPKGVIVLALATLEHLSVILSWLDSKKSREPQWNYRLLQVQLSRSVPFAHLTRFDPLNPVIIVTISLT